MKTTFFYLLLLIPVFLWGQRGVVTGVMTDSSGLPLPGVNIAVVGKAQGTQSDFDGFYSIECLVGDTLRFTYLGQKTKEVTVTAAMFSSSVRPEQGRQLLELPKYNSAFSKALEYSSNYRDTANVFKEKSMKYEVSGRYLDISNIQKITEGPHKVRVKINPKYRQFEIDINQSSSVQFVQNAHLPALQTTFGQGRPLNQQLRWRGPETGELFSYGPSLSQLEYNGLAYPYDTRGSLVNRGEGNGQVPQPNNNAVLSTGINTRTSVHLKVTDDYHRRREMNLAFHNNRQSDLFNRATNQLSQFDALLGRRIRGNMELRLNVNYSKAMAGNANINGLHSQILQSAWITPPSFANNQGVTLPDNTQRSFSPNAQNNPFWLLQNNQNAYNTQQFSSTAAFDFEPSHILEMTTVLTYQREQQEFEVGLPVGTIGFDSGYTSSKDFQVDDLRLNQHFRFDNFYLESFGYLEAESSFEFNADQLEYEFIENDGQSNAFSNREFVRKTTWEWINKMEFQDIDVFGDNEMDIALWNSSFGSSLQGTQWFLPSVRIVNKFSSFYSSFLNRIETSFNYSESAVDLPLFYENLSHNSLNLLAENSASYTANSDLFNNSSLNLELVRELEFQLKMDLFSHRLELTGEVFRSVNKNSIFPVFDNQQWLLKNSADVVNKGFSLGAQLWLYPVAPKGFSYRTTFQFEAIRPTVQRLFSEDPEGLPIAGFQNVNKRLIEGEAVGLIYGSAFARNEQGEVLIGADGFPLVAPESQRIGNPNPVFGLGWTNTFELKNFQLQFVFDYQHGGDVWNGTESALNYYGTSAESGRLRGVQDFMFQGVDLQGNPNTQAVDFAPSTGLVSENRWVRYGVTGVAEENIVDGSFLMLKSAKLSFSKQLENQFFKEISFSVYGTNLFQWGPARQLNPYSALFGGSSAKGLHYFNLPLQTELGIHFNLKI